jgi:hypothetical protein
VWVLYIYIIDSPPGPPEGRGCTLPRAPMQSVEGPYNFLIEAGLLNREYKSYPTESVPDNMQYGYIKAKYIAKHRFSLFYNYDVMGAIRKTCWRRRGPWESFQEQPYP